MSPDISYLSKDAWGGPLSKDNHSTLVRLRVLRIHVIVTVDRVMHRQRAQIVAVALSDKRTTSRIVITARTEQALNHHLKEATRVLSYKFLFSIHDISPISRHKGKRRRTEASNLLTFKALPCQCSCSHRSQAQAQQRSPPHSSPCSSRP